MRNSPTRRINRLAKVIVISGCLWASCSNAPHATAPTQDKVAADRPRVPAAPPTLKRLHYENVLSQSPGHFFQRMPVEPALRSGQFVGYAVIALYGDSAPHPEGVHLGDIITRVNGSEINTPERFHKVWVEAKGRRLRDVEVLRENTVRKITYRIID